MYRVFVRDFWKPNPSWPNGREPYGGAPKHTICTVETAEEAREACAEWTHNHYFTPRDKERGRAAEFEKV
jgi:hypothetical protein